MDSSCSFEPSKKRGTIYQQIDDLVARVAAIEQFLNDVIEEEQRGNSFEESDTVGAVEE